MSMLQAPRAPPDQLRLESSRVLARLRLIIEFKPWLEYTRLYHHTKREAPVKLLWDCFAFGAPLCTLLNLLGSPTPAHLNVKLDEFDFDLPLDHRELFVTSFIERVQMLEAQRRLPFGEVLRPGDLFDGTNAGFLKVLRMVQRVLSALGDSYPGIFILPAGSTSKRRQRIQNLLDTEQAHVSNLRTVMSSASAISEAIPSSNMDPCLECLLVNHSRLRKYHEHVLHKLEAVVADPALEDWDKIFIFEDSTTRIKMTAAHRSICANYLGLCDFLHLQVGRNPHDSTLAEQTRALLDLLPCLPSRLLEYHALLQDILDMTLPTECHSYDALCSLIFKLRDTSENIHEMGWHLRTSRSALVLKGRAYIWDHAVDPSELGPLLLDDRLLVGGTEMYYSVFLFESMLLCCLEGPDKLVENEGQLATRYPLRPWELGPALRRTTPLNLIHAIPTRDLKVLRYGESDCEFDLDWVESDGYRNTLEFTSTCPAQNAQWCSTLEMFIPSVMYQPPPHVPLHGNDDEAFFSEDEDADGRRHSHPRPWSLIARKGTRSESSSFIQQEIDDVEDAESFLSPRLLPTLFSDKHLSDVPASPLSPLSIDTREQRVSSPEHMSSLMLPTPPPDLDPAEGDFKSLLLNLTGKITRESRYPEAHGGFADVWKGTWHDGPYERKVAVKVLRAKMDDPDMEEKMAKRLSRELHVWKRLNHPNILPLYGTASDFGHSESMVCPWLDNGSVSKYLERCGDILSMSDRLQMLCDVAEGLRYLHTFSVVHGDLTGSNILISDKGKACLCDFGLSSIVAEFQGTSYFTSSIGGAVRWADASLYKIQAEQDDIPSISSQSDIYSFGSVTLEVLSGRIPYHYLRSDALVVIEMHKGVKPRRPSPSFVTETQWMFITQCWADDPNDRPAITDVCRTIQGLYKTSLATRTFRTH